MKQLSIFLSSMLAFGPNLALSQSYLKGPAYIDGTTTVTTAGGTTTLTKDSNPVQIFSGTSAQTVVLPSATTLPVGRAFEFYSTTTKIVTIQASGGTLLKNLAPNEKSQFRLTANGTAAGTWAVENNAAVNLAASTYYGSLEYTSTAACDAWLSTSTSWTTLPADTGCLAPNVTGGVTAPATKIPGFTLANAAPGTYHIVPSGWFTKTTSTNGAAYFRMTDGTNNYGASFMYAGANPSMSSVSAFTITLTSAQTLNLQYQCRNEVASSQCGIYLSDTDRNLKFDVYYFPSQAQTVVRMDQIRVPTITKLTTASGASGVGTYTVPAGVTQLNIRMVGGGGGGSHASSGNGGAGGNTTFGGTLLVANGGGGGGVTTNGGAGGTASIGTGPIGSTFAGSWGAPGQYLAVGGQSPNYSVGGNGGSSPFGGSGGGSLAGDTGKAAGANTGSGGGGGSTGGSSGAVASTSGSGGGSGGYVEATISGATLASSFAYVVGAAGAAGGTGSYAGGVGGSGYIEITEIYGWNLPIVIGGVSSNNSTGAERIERARINAGDCSIASQSGSWLTKTSGTASGTGCNYAITAGIFSSAPTCIVTPLDGNIIIYLSDFIPTATEVRLRAKTVSSGSDYPGTPFLMCMGPR